jgi:hypothetical protein
MELQAQEGSLVHERYQELLKEYPKADTWMAFQGGWASAFAYVRRVQSMLDNINGGEQVWYSVDKDLPDDFQQVLAVNKTPSLNDPNSTNIEYVVAYYDSSSECWTAADGDNELHHVTHWIELPDYCVTAE